MGEVRIHRQGYRSLFWPIVLIAIGVIWLLGNIGLISAANLVVVFKLWPLLLIIVGLDLLFGRQSPALGALIGIGAVVLIIVLMVIGPSIGLAGSNLEVKSTSYSEPLEDASSANVNLNLGVAKSSITAVSDSTDLFQADVRYVGNLVYEHEGTTAKTINLRAEQQDVGFFQGLDFLGATFNPQNEDLHWDVQLSPKIPLALNVQGGVGDSNFDLSQLQLTSLQISSGVGQMDLSLPSVADTLQRRCSQRRGRNAAQHRRRRSAQFECGWRCGCGHD